MKRFSDGGWWEEPVNTALTDLRSHEPQELHGSVCLAPQNHHKFFTKF